ncbi:rhomboid family intramembrane serine protease [Yinghuangia seranimata]|uniref:rhomboid family intramembrane serine protease n=1 Tax=Yinghuangia seranimata TaxID=408067 RepID=UPI00248AAB47|nr:rhomboid family intramembrane serine protease [Yinghuangia seranimata]MDI2127218.1 rhomboid family intramembrane serine protease [Yinghuangia seranimata]
MTTERAADKGGEAGTGPPATPDAPVAPVAPSRLRQVGERVGRFLGHARRAPLTLVTIAVIWGVAIGTGSVGGGPDRALRDQVGAGPAPLAEGHWWSPLSSALWHAHLGPLIGASLLVLAVLVPAERMFGRRRTLGLLVACQVLGSLLGSAAVAIGSALGEDWLEGLYNDPGELALGCATGVAGVGLALTAYLSTLWRRRWRLLGLVALILFALYGGGTQDILRLFGGLVGLVAGEALWRRAGGRRLKTPPSHAETRVLVALLVASSAFGPAIARITKPFGPLSLYADLFVGEGPSREDIATACEGVSPTSSDCVAVRVEDFVANSPSVVLLYVVSILLVVVAGGLRRGRRMAWWSAVVLEIGITVVTIRYTQVTLHVIDVDASTTDDSLRGVVLRYSVLVAAVPVVVLLILLVTRRYFALRTPKWTAWKLLTVVVGAFVVLGAIYIGSAYQVRGEFAPVPTFDQVAQDFPKRLVPPIYLLLFDVPQGDFVPEGGTAKLLFELAGPVFWLVTIGGLWFMLWRAIEHDKSGAANKARDILTRYGGSTLSYMTTWPGNTYWLATDGKTAVAYRVISNVAVTTGDPFGKADERADAVGGFAAFCDRQGWTPCFYSVTENGREAGEALGWRSLQVAEDTVVPLPDLEFKGKKWQDVRTALNKAGKAGLTAQWWVFPDAPLGVQKQVREISEEWVADKGLPEMGFTLGGLDELDDPHVRCLVAVDGDERVHGVTSWMPSYRDGEPVGWTLDFMRRGDTDFKGIMEFLIASAALGFKEEGAEFLSLSGAPLARIDRGGQPEMLQGVLDVAGRALEPVYGFRSLLAFKAKFQPQYQPLYMTYPDATALPSIANAIGRAYLPHTSPAQMLRLSRRLVG